MVMNDWRVQSWVTSEECRLSLRPVTCPAERPEARDALTAAVSFGLPVTLLVALDLLVIAGNSLVIVSVLTDRKLRSVTNTFIISLAVSDLLLGITVLPFSSANEVLGYWPFGTLWCSAWLAIDVWLCTASILNLCAISLDRFLAISRPIRYPSLMTRSKARLFVVGVWVLAFCIAIPPLLGWNGGSEDHSPNRTWTQTSTTVNWTLDLVTAALSCNSTDRYPGHARSTRFNEALQSASGSHADCTYAQPKCALTSETSYIIYSASGSFWVPMLFMVFFYIRIYRTANLATSALRRGVVATKRPSPTPGPTSAPRDLDLRVHRGGCNPGFTTSTQSNCFPEVGPRRMTQLRSQLALDPFHFRSSVYVLPSAGSVCSVACSEEPSSPDVASSSGGGGARNSKAVFQIRNQLRRLNREKKAAKTVGIVVGCFIFCWTPFFAVYLLGAFCVDCTPHSVFAVFFWLGYCNSAVNPLLYGLCSKDFRRAFRQLVCCHRRPRPRVKKLQRSLVLYARSR